MAEYKVIVGRESEIEDKINTIAKEGYVVDKVYYDKYRILVVMRKNVT